MNPIHVHLILNHVPVLGAFAAAALLLYASWREDNEAARFGLWALVLSAVSCVPVFLSGEGAEKLVGPLTGLPRQYVHLHEEAAELAMWFSAAAGIVAAWTLHRRRDGARLSMRAVRLCAVLALAACAALGRAAALGGQLRHPEIQADWKDFR